MPGLKCPGSDGGLCGMHSVRYTNMRWGKAFHTELNDKKGTDSMQAECRRAFQFCDCPGAVLHTASHIIGHCMPWHQLWERDRKKVRKKNSTHSREFAVWILSEVKCRALCKTVKKCSYAFECVQYIFILCRFCLIVRGSLQRVIVCVVIFLLQCCTTWKTISKLLSKNGNPHIQMW